MPLRDVTPQKTNRAGDGGAGQGTVDRPPNPTDVALDVALSALETFLDDTTSTTQRRAARDAVRAVRAKRTPAQTP